MESLDEVAADDDTRSASVETRDGRPWIVDLARAQEQRPASTNSVYDADRQMTHLEKPGYPAAIDSAEPRTTKKADLETGEDQKGF